MTKRVLNKIRKEIEALGFNHFDGDYGLCVHNENDTEDVAFDYYGEFTGFYPWINPKLETLAKKIGGYWEWVNPATIVLVED